METCDPGIPRSVELCWWANGMCLWLPGLMVVWRGRDGVCVLGWTQHILTFKSPRVLSPKPAFLEFWAVSCLCVSAEISRKEAKLSLWWSPGFSCMRHDFCTTLSTAGNGHWATQNGLKKHKPKQTLSDPPGAAWTNSLQSGFCWALHYLRSYV